MSRLPRSTHTGVDLSVPLRPTDVKQAGGLGTEYRWDLDNPEGGFREDAAGIVFQQAAVILNLLDAVIRKRSNMT